VPLPINYSVPHYRSLDDIQLQVSWLTVGVFDGVHRGHQEIIHRLVGGAHEHGLPAVVLTFYPHPEVILGKQKDIRYLTLPDEKADLFASLGVDVVITHPFTPEFSNLSAENLMTRLRSHLGVERLWIGHDFALGRARQGDAVSLRELGEKLGYDVQTIEPVQTGNRIISSHNIRNHLNLGQVTEAAADLGRFYTLTGRVVHGDGRGRKINIPTANLDIPVDKLIPAYGVYACRVRIVNPVKGGETGTKFPAVTNIGTRPTFDLQTVKTNIETHLLDFDRRLYGQELQVEFVSRLREERRFSSANELLEQIRQDIQQTREIL